MAALYLRGAPRPFDVKRAGWVDVERALRLRAPCISEASSVLRDGGLWAEATALETPGLVEWSCSLFEKGGGHGTAQVLTAADPAYPIRWLERLGRSSPPALWMEGEMPCCGMVAIVGSRSVSRAVLRFASDCGTAAAAAGYAVVSGGAKGCDSAAVRNASQGVVEVLPFGLNSVPARVRRAATAGRQGHFCRLSVCAPGEEFTTASAMERNALIYAMSEAAVIVHARFKQGGTWHGSVDAHRRKLTRLVVREDPTSPAHRALVGLGALTLKRPNHLQGVLDEPPIQAQLVC